MTLELKTFVEPPLSNNNYLLIDSESHEAVFIDCSASDDRIMAYIQEQGATLKYILLTHAHFDHVLGVDYFQKKYHGCRAVRVCYRDRHEFRGYSFCGYADIHQREHV